VFGHIHEDAGVTFDGRTLYVNAANVSIRYRPFYPCIVVDLPYDRNKSARIVVPKCNLTGEEILIWLRDHGYNTILPIFEKCKPLLDGSDLVCREMNFDELVQKVNINHENYHNSNQLQNQSQHMSVSSFFTMKKWKEEFIAAMLHLRSVSYD
jgi:hypothetical protein